MISRALVFSLLLAAGPAFGQGNPSFNVINKSGQPIRELFATPAGDLSFGRSRLNGRPIPPGGAQAIRLPPGTNCVYDIRIAYADGHNEDRRGIDTCRGTDLIAGADMPVGGATGGATGAAAGKSDPSFRLINRGKSAVVEVTATAPGQPRGGNRLPAGVSIAPGASDIVHLSADAGCVYDLHVTFADHAGRDKKAADLCRITNLPVQ